MVVPQTSMRLLASSKRSTGLLIVNSTQTMLRLHRAILCLFRIIMQSLASMQLTVALSPKVFGEVIAANAALSGRAQVEGLLHVASRLALYSPKHLARAIEVLVAFIARCMPASLGGAVSVTSLLAKQSLSRQVIAVGLHANAASALAATTVQIGIHTCVLLQRGVTRPELSELARQQFWYDATTALTVGGASIVGGGCGAVVGGLLLPGVGTALGSLAGSLGGGFLPYMLRCTGPEVQRRRELQELSRYCETERPLQIAESDGDWLVVCDGGSCTQCVHWDTIENDNEWCVEELFRDGCSGPSRCEEEADAQRAEAWGEGGTDELAAVDHFIELIDTTMVKQTAEGIVEGNEQTLATRVALR